MTTTALPPRMSRNAPQPRVATDRQINFVRKLISERVDILPETFAEDFEAQVIEGLSGAGASALITMLTDEFKPVRRAPLPFVLEPGMYRKGDDFYKVQMSKTTGRWYAKQVQRNPETGRVSFAYVGRVWGLVAEHRLTLDEAKEFGVATGACIVCGITLTKPESIEAGIGPICAGKV